MLDVRLTYPTPEGSREISVDPGRITFGRGDVTVRFDDEGLSRVHATVYREGERVWIVDENSSNGTFVNGVQVFGSGTPLKNGDNIKIGNSTSMNVRMSEQHLPPPVFQPNVAPMGSQSVESAATAFSLMSILPIALIAVAFLVISVSAVVIGYKLFFSGGQQQVVQTDGLDDDFDTPEKKSSPTPKTSGTNTAATSSNGNTSITDSPSGNSSTTTVSLPAGKQYLSMSETERRQYLAERAMKIAQVIGNNSSEAIPDAAIDKIKAFTDGYAKRLNVKAGGGCKFGDNLQSTYERASKNAPFIVKAFNEKGTDPRIGLYLAMIESEHCVCLQSPTGPLGMFQFTFSTAKLHFTPNDGVIKGASPSSPDERCKPEPAARAAASYMKALTGRYGTGPSSVPLAIGSYNSGEGGLSTNLVKALESNSGLPRDFWTLIAKGDILSKQFQSENFKYVPKFFAAAIIGENPQDFGLKLQPLSTYNR
jgi:hypothetical protein